MLMLASLSDDQFALIGCGVALVFSFGLMSLSYFLGSARQTAETADTIRFESLRTETEQERPVRHAA
jgi:hypothetical protein